MKCELIAVSTYKFEFTTTEFIRLLKSQGFNIPVSGKVKLHSGRNGFNLERDSTLCIQIEEAVTEPLDSVLPG